MLKAIKAFFKNLFQSDKAHMLNLILFGPPGSGKGTQAVQLAEKYGLLHISTGDLFRYEMGNDTPLGKEAKSYISKGELVPDSVTIGMLKNKVNANPDVGGYIFDGFPRTIAQAEALNVFLSEKGQKVAGLLSLKVEDSEIIKRLLERGKSSGRADDQNDSIIQNRIEVYKSETSPVFKFYAKSGQSQEIAGMGSIADVFHNLTTAIDKWS